MMSFRFSPRCPAGSRYPSRKVMVSYLMNMSSFIPNLSELNPRLRRKQDLSVKKRQERLQGKPRQQLRRSPRRRAKELLHQEEVPERRIPRPDQEQDRLLRTTHYSLWEIRTYTVEALLQTVQTVQVL